MRKKGESCLPGLVEMNWNDPFFGIVALEAVLFPAVTTDRDHIFFRLVQVAKGLGTKG